MLLYVVFILLPAIALVHAECDREAYRILFEVADANNDSSISVVEGFKLFIAFDEDKNGIVTVQEIIALAPKKAPGLVGREQSVFNFLDRDGDGKLTPLDLILQYLKYDKDHNLSKDEAEYKCEVEDYCKGSSEPDVGAEVGQIISSLIK